MFKSNEEKHNNCTMKLLLLPSFLLCLCFSFSFSRTRARAYVRVQKLLSLQIRFQYFLKIGRDRGFDKFC